MVNLRDIPLLAPLSDEDLRQMGEKAIVKRFGRNETILAEYNASTAIYVVLDGKVKAVQVTEDGKEIIFAFHQTGDCFGETSLIDGEASPAALVSVTPSTVAVIRKEDILPLLSLSHGFLSSILRSFCIHIRRAWATIEMLNVKSPARRIQNLLYHLSLTHGRRTEEGIFLSVTHQDIASMSGLTRETVTRAIAKWQAEGKVTAASRLLRVDPQFFSEMTEYSGFSPH